MCCLFGCGNGCGCNRCQNERIIRGPIGPRGPQGPRGPIGPQGATGATGATGTSGTADIIYAGTNASQTVAAGAIIPISLIASTANTTMSVSSNAVNLPSAGTYLVSFFAQGTTETTPMSTALYLNGTAISGETVTVDTTDGENSSGKTVLITTSGAATLSLYNLSTGSDTLSSATITVLRSI